MCFAPPDILVCAPLAALATTGLSTRPDMVSGVENSLGVITLAPYQLAVYTFQHVFDRKVSVSAA